MRANVRLPRRLRTIQHVGMFDIMLINRKENLILTRLAPMIAIVYSRALMRRD